jgi:hypothetical protein
VIVRDPYGKQPDDFFFSTNLAMSPEAVASAYAGRWSIGDCNRNVSSSWAARTPSAGWEAAGACRRPLHVALLGCLAMVSRPPRRDSALAASAVVCRKRTPSFADALAALRRAL